MPLYTLNNVRSYKNYGFLIYGNTYDPLFTKGVLNSSPNLSIQGSSCFIDYSHVYDTSDRIYLNRIFGSLTAGNTFTFNATKYYDPELDYIITLNGVCEYQQTLNDNKIIVAGIVSGLTGSTTYNFYNKHNFVNSPQYRFNTLGNTANNYILNTLPNTSTTTFEKMGVLGSDLGFEEYIEISGGTGSNFGRLSIEGTGVLIDNQEIMFIGVTLQNQNLSTTSTQLTHYIRGKSDVDEIQQPQNILGIYRVHDSNNHVIDCYENQNYYQTYLRKQALGTTQSGYWVACETCPKDIYSEDLSSTNQPSNLLFDNSVYLFIAQTTLQNQNLITQSIVYSVFTQRNFTGGAQTATRMTFAITTGLKIDLSHSSLQGWEFEVYSDSLYTIKLGKNYYVSGKPGFDQSYVLITNGIDVPRTLYCRFVGPQILNMVINI